MRSVALEHVQVRTRDGRIPADALVSLVADADEVYEKRSFLSTSARLLPSPTQAAANLASSSPIRFYIPRFELFIYNLNCAMITVNIV